MQQQLVVFVGVRPLGVRCCWLYGRGKYNSIQRLAVRREVGGRAARLLATGPVKTDFAGHIVALN